VTFLSQDGRSWFPSDIKSTILIMVITSGLKSSWERIFIRGSGVLIAVGCPMKYSPLRSAIILTSQGYCSSSKKVIVMTRRSAR